MSVNDQKNIYLGVSVHNVDDANRNMYCDLWYSEIINRFVLFDMFGIPDSAYRVKVRELDRSIYEIVSIAPKIAEFMSNWSPMPHDILIKLK